MDSLSVVAGQLWFLSLVNRLGDVASSAHGIALGWEALGYLSGAAFGTAAMTLVGQNLGARRPEQAGQTRSEHLEHVHLILLAGDAYASPACGGPHSGHDNRAGRGRLLIAADCGWGLVIVNR